jgi:hypothetical protein
MAAMRSTNAASDASGSNSATNSNMNWSMHEGSDKK